MSGDGGILSAVCQCPRGNWICSHMAAAAIFANRKGLSKTDFPSSWIAKPKKAAKIDSKAIADFFPHPKPSYRATSRKATQQDKEFFHRKLAEANSDCPFQWMSGPEPGAPVQSPEAPCLIEDILNIFFSDKAAFIVKCKVSAEQIAWLALRTVGQRSSQLCGTLRRLRLTGSNFGEVLSIELEGLECVLSHMTRNDYGKSKWCQHVGKKTARSRSGECFVAVFLAFSKCFHKFRAYISEIV